MNDTDRERLDRVEAKVDRILTILDDPDFGLRYRVNHNTDSIASLKNQLYGLVSGFVVMLGGVIFSLVR